MDRVIKTTKVTAHGTSLTVNVTDLCGLLQLQRGDPVTVYLERVGNTKPITVIYGGQVTTWDSKEDAISYLTHTVDGMPKDVIDVIEALNRGNEIVWDGGKIPEGWEDKLQIEQTND